MLRSSTEEDIQYSMEALRLKAACICQSPFQKDFYALGVGNRLCFRSYRE